ncbi:MAG: UDP-2,3-diacylglucosamine diphosphatase [Planctomycetota bacterium]
MSANPESASPERASPEPAVIALRPDERVWVTGDVHIAPGDEQRAAFFLAFLAAARRSADRLVLLGDVFDYWVGPRHGRRCAYRPVLEAFEAAAREGYPIDFIAGNRDFLGPGELRSLGLRVQGDLVVYERAGARTIVTHGDLLVAGDRSYKRFRRVVRSWWFRLGYWLVPVWFRLLVAWLLRGASQRKLAKVEPYAFPVDTALSQAWLAQHGARDLLMGHLHREELHEHPEGRTTRMLPGWSAAAGPHFVLGPPAELQRFEADLE